MRLGTEDTGDKIGGDKEAVDAPLNPIAMGLKPIAIGLTITNTDPHPAAQYYPCLA